MALKVVVLGLTMSVILAVSGCDDHGTTPPSEPAAGSTDTPVAGARPPSVLPVATAPATVTTSPTAAAPTPTPASAHVGRMVLEEVGRLIILVGSPRPDDMEWWGDLLLAYWRLQAMGVALQQCLMIGEPAWSHAIEEARRAVDLIVQGAQTLDAAVVRAAVDRLVASVTEMRTVAQRVASQCI